MIEGQSIRGNHVPESALPQRKETDREQQLRETSLEFERLLAQQMIESMQSTLEGGFFEREDSSSRWYMNIFNRELAAELTGKDGQGLARALYEQVARRDWAADPVIRSAHGSRSFDPFTAIKPEADAAERVRRSAARWRAPSSERRRELEQLVRGLALRRGLDADWIAALVETESAWDERARSAKGALGLMQLLPETAGALGVRNPLDPRENVEGGLRYLQDLLGRFKGDRRLAAAAYNAGPEAVDRHRGVPPFAETRVYVERIEALMREKQR